MALQGSEETGLGSVPTAAGSDSPGEGGGVGTLAQVYAAGAAAPAADDLMAMLSGTTARFQANTDANPLPLIGLYETAASKGLTTSGYPSIGQSLATDLSLLIGGRIFNWCEMFDPNWNGTFAALSAYAWHVDTVSFQQTATTAWRRNHVFADRSYIAAKNWQPQATPAGPLGSGPGTMLHNVQLYNTLDDALEDVDQLDGFGQNLRQVSPIQNGVIYETATHFSHRLVSVPAANDGVGWGVWDGDISHGGDVPRAAWSARTVGASAAGDWYLAFSLQDTAGDGLLHDVATLARTGITFDVPVSFGDPTGIAFAATSAEIDLTATHTGIVLAPARAGFRFVANRCTFTVTQVGGSLSSAANIQGGTDAPKVNAFGPNNTVFAALLFGIGAGAFTNSSATGSSTSANVSPPNAPLVMDVTVAATGTALTFKGRATVFGTYVPV